MKKIIDKLTLEVYANRSEAGFAAGNAAAEVLINVLKRKGKARIIFAAAPSQNECLDALIHKPGINWSKISAFHMDEYIGLAPDAPQRFVSYLKDHVFDHVSFGAVNLLEGNDPETLCIEYAEKLAAEPIDIVCLGVGENGHIAFNDPPVADFNDSKLVKIVELDMACRQQQVNDGCFPTLDAVPKRAVTLTIPALMRADYLICTVPGHRKRNAVHAMLEQPISTACPAGILRTHKNCRVFVDQECWS